jgi:hypothetical protein
VGILGILRGKGEPRRTSRGRSGTSQGSGTSSGNDTLTWLAPVRLNPKFDHALYWRGIAKHRMRDVAGSESDIAAARKINPNVGK